MPKTKTHGGARKGAGRPKTSPGWATISVRVPVPTRDAWMALPPETRRKLLAAFVAAVERAIG